MSHENFYLYVKTYIQDNPDAAGHISDYVVEGIEESRREILERAADMEIALSVAVAKRWSGRENLIISKLEKWRNKGALSWDDTIAMLKTKV